MSASNNPAGVNGYGVKRYPPDDELSAALHGYARERLTCAERLERLRIEYGLEIKERKLLLLNKQFGVPSVRKPPTEAAATALVLEEVAADVNQNNGTGTIGTLIANKGILIPRDTIRQILAVHAPEGLNKRFPGMNRIKRSSLSALGPGHQYHADGHEKLNAQALAMGGVGITIYGIKDQWSSFIIHLVAVPNNRLADTIGHVYLDAIEKTKHIPITMVVDKGSEVGEMFAHQTGLRQVYTDLDTDQYPPVLQIRSVHNTPIEGLWHWFLKTYGFNIKDIIINGYRDGYYNPNNPVHPLLFRWLWPKIVQEHLNTFTNFWNTHRIRTQKGKPNMSGSTPQHGFLAPKAPAEKIFIPVHQEVLDHLRSEIRTPRDEAMRWVSTEFSDIAQAAYVTIGSPPFTPPTTGWETFTNMLPHIPRDAALE